MLSRFLEEYNMIHYMTSGAGQLCMPIYFWRSTEIFASNVADGQYTLAQTTVGNW